ncbi:MAG: nitroreductase family protein [Thermoleophilia bacterium]|nr:nitroreductase family protein [Thermoleophilia bacterium]
MIASESLGFPVALAEMPAVEWTTAISRRHSSRTLDGTPIDPALLDRLESFCAGLPANEVARVVVIRTLPDGLFTGIVGSYGRVRGAPAALVFVGAETHPAVQESVGYLGEAVILEATSLGLATCWVGGFFKPHVAARLVTLDKGERVLAVSPLGHAAVRPPARDRLFKQAMRAHGRKPLEELAPGSDFKMWPAWALKGLELARISPSAVNRQPWRFAFEPGAVVISTTESGPESGISRRLDCGIAMLHFEVGARSLGASGRWETLQAPRVARFELNSIVEGSKAPVEP